MRSYIFTLLIFFITIVIALFFIEHPYTYQIKKTANVFQDGSVIYEVKNIRDITTKDHILGLNKEEPPFVLIEYSDYTCLFCASMRKTIKEVVDEHGATLVYRHFFPLNNTNGIKRAVSAECVAEISGEEIFWQYTGFLYNTRPTSITDRTLSRFGVDIEKYNNCVENPNKKIAKIQKETRKLQKIGARGTPFILVVKDNKIAGYTYATSKENFIKIITESIK